MGLPQAQSIPGCLRQLLHRGGLDPFSQKVTAEAVGEVPEEAGQVVGQPEHTQAQPDAQHPPEGQAEPRGDSQPDDGTGETGQTGPGSGQRGACHSCRQQQHAVPPVRCGRHQQDGDHGVVETGHVLVPQQAGQDTAIGVRYQPQVEQWDVEQQTGERSLENTAQIQSTAGEGPHETGQDCNAEESPQPVLLSHSIDRG